MSRGLSDVASSTTGMTVHLSNAVLSRCSEHESNWSKPHGKRSPLGAEAPRLHTALVATAMTMTAVAMIVA